jgi:hypothetical protein
MYGPGDVKGEERFLTYCDADQIMVEILIEESPQVVSYMVKVGSGVVGWSSKLQPVVTLSTMEAEYVAGVSAGKEICWMQHLLIITGDWIHSHLLHHPHYLFIDNPVCYFCCKKNPEHHGQMKHLDLAFFWLRDKVAEGSRIQVVHLCTEDMPADLLTKALPKPQVLKLKRLMGLVW